MPGGVDLRFDPVLGLLFDRQQHIMRPSASAPWTSTSKKVVNRLPACAGNGRCRYSSHAKNGPLPAIGIDELIAFDNGQHRITVYSPLHDFAELISWQVFSDDQYPYGYRDEELEKAEPRLIAAGDFEGDGRYDLMLISQDRWLIYLGQDEGAAK